QELCEVERHRREIPPITEALEHLEPLAQGTLGCCRITRHPRSPGLAHRCPCSGNGEPRAAHNVDPPTNQRQATLRIALHRDEKAEVRLRVLGEYRAACTGSALLDALDRLVNRHRPEYAAHGEPAA